MTGRVKRAWPNGAIAVSLFVILAIAGCATGNGGNLAGTAGTGSAAGGAGSSAAAGSSGKAGADAAGTTPAGSQVAGTAASPGGNGSGVPAELAGVAVRLSIRNAGEDLVVHSDPLELSFSVSPDSSADSVAGFSVEIFNAPDTGQPATASGNPLITATLDHVSGEVSLAGLLDGSSYAIRGRGLGAAGGATPWSPFVRFALELGLPAAVAVDPVDGGVTISPTPTLHFRYPGSASKFRIQVVRLEAYTAAGSNGGQTADASLPSAARRTAVAYDPGETAGPVSLPPKLLQLGADSAFVTVDFFRTAKPDFSRPMADTETAADTYRFAAAIETGDYAYRIRTLDKSGVWSGWSPPRFFRVSSTAEVRPTILLDGESSISTAPTIGWQYLSGADAYQVEVSSQQSGADIYSGKVASVSLHLDDSLQQGKRYYYRVAPISAARGALEFSRWYAFTVGGLGLSFLPVVQSGSPAVFHMGDTFAGWDAAPVHPVELTAPFSMSVTETTNAQFATVMNWARSHGLVSFTSGAIVSTTMLNAGTSTSAGGAVPPGGVEVAGLDQLSYGRQFGLALQQDRITAIPAYANHPVTGVSWYGALLYADCASILAGFDEAYDPSTGAWNRTAHAYRLPTEAEWEYAMRGNDARAFPWGNTLAANAANYYRSYDPYEDVSPPYTAAGGPTTPVDFYLGTVRNGYRTRDGRSPFGIEDMVGNVWEWCWDRYAPDTYSVDAGTSASGPVADPAGAEIGAGAEAGAAPGAGSGAGNDTGAGAARKDAGQQGVSEERVTRGGAWNTPESYLRGTSRGHYAPEGESYSTGFRLVLGGGPPVPPPGGAK